MCELCESNKKSGDKFCRDCGTQVNEKMAGESGCQRCKCLVECKYVCVYRPRLVKGWRPPNPINCGHQLGKLSYCPNCGEQTLFFVNRIYVNKEVAYKIAIAKDIDDLFNHIAASDPRAEYNGPIIFRILIWDGRVIQAIKNNGVEENTRTNKVIFFNAEALKPALKKLISRNDLFITVDGSEVCSLTWSIHDIK